MILTPFILNGFFKINSIHSQLFKKEYLSNYFKIRYNFVVNYIQIIPKLGEIEKEEVKNRE
jgi:hypothetical protein